MGRFPLNDVLTTPETPYPVPPPVPHDERPDGHKVGMLAFFVSEVAFFSTLIMAYVIYLGHDEVGPTPAQALSLQLVIGTTICLLASSFTIHVAEGQLRNGRRIGFAFWWSLTIILGALFIAGTAYEWFDLITKHHLTIGRNMFGTTFFTLVGFHALHVTAGLVLLSIILGMFLRGTLKGLMPIGVELAGWYWHFVDGVWVVVFLIVYVFGRS